MSAPHRLIAGGPAPWDPRPGESTGHYALRLAALPLHTLRPLAAGVLPGAPELERHAAALRGAAELGVLPPDYLRTVHLRLGGRPEDPAPSEPALFFARERAEEDSLLHAAAFDAALARGAVADQIELMWALSKFERAKSVALRSVDELRGAAVEIGRGTECKACKGRETIFEVIQTRSGDEPPRILVRCLRASCRTVTFVD